MYQDVATNKSWSPNALMLRLKTELIPNIKLLSAEIIYQWIYEDARSGGVLYKLLPRSHRNAKVRHLKKRSNPQQTVDPFSTRLLKNGVVLA